MEYDEKFFLKYRNLFKKWDDKTDNEIIDKTIKQLKQEAQKELLKDIIENDITDFNGYNGISLISIKDRLKQIRKW